MRIRKEVIVVNNQVLTTSTTLPPTPINTEEFDTATIIWAIKALSGTSPSLNIINRIYSQDLSVNVDSQTIINNVTGTWRGPFRAERLGYGLRIRFDISGTNPSFTVWCAVILEKNL